ncbi:MAG: TetR family transcriptional regulator [Actinobacteria bacterium]|uniref:Unannotated protein n=2 Tax=freshwater metagenome TaxID=449393 RepID=A0A6J6Z4P5_9ZZZZ|nr:TetR family transcriptional regulator [Actinomycetota bacterium]
MLCRMARTPRPSSAAPRVELPPGTRDRMLQMAIDAIERGGEASVRVREVSDATGVSFASLYHFFGSREGLVEEALAEIYVRSIRDFNIDIGERIARCESADDFYRTVSGLSLESYSPDRSALRFQRLSVLGGVAGRPNLAVRVASAQDASNRALAGILAEPQRRGWIHPDVDLITLAAWTAGLTLGRVLIELDPLGTNGAAWNEMSIATLIALAKGDLLR